jgi:hypothetical protein
MNLANPFGSRFWWPTLQCNSWLISIVATPDDRSAETAVHRNPPKAAKSQTVGSEQSLGWVG